MSGTRQTTLGEQSSHTLVAEGRVKPWAPRPRMPNR
jgi:hypothetical protein